MQPLPRGASGALPTRRPAGVVAGPSASVPVEANAPTWWVELSEPPVGAATPPGGRAPDRERVLRQQDAVMARLADLGAIELGRVAVLRNALAVRMPASAAQAARDLAGVTAVRVTRDMRQWGHTPDEGHTSDAPSFGGTGRQRSETGPRAR